MYDKQNLDFKFSTPGFHFLNSFKKKKKKKKLLELVFNLSDLTSELTTPWKSKTQTENFQNQQFKITIPCLKV